MSQTLYIHFFLCRASVVRLKFNEWIPVSSILKSISWDTSRFFKFFRKIFEQIKTRGINTKGSVILLPRFFFSRYILLNCCAAFFE